MTKQDKYAQLYAELSKNGYATNAILKTLTTEDFSEIIGVKVIIGAFTLKEISKSLIADFGHEKYTYVITEDSVIIEVKDEPKNERYQEIYDVAYKVLNTALIDAWIEIYEKLKIETGDISPMQTLAIDELQQKLANLITEITIQNS
jgi:hypothetical protein